MTRSEEAQRRAIRASGAWAFSLGRAYETNPYRPDQKDAHLWWSEGFNNARAAKGLQDENRSA